MNFLLFLIFNFAFANINSLPEIQTPIVKRSDVNRLYSALSFSIVPRSSNGSPCDSCANLGSTAFKWNDLKLSRNFNLRNQLGALINVQSVNIDDSVITGGVSDNILDGSLSITTTGKPLIFFVQPQSPSSPTYFSLDQDAGVSCAAGFEINIDGANIFRSSHRILAASANYFSFPGNLLFHIHTGILSNGAHSITLEVTPGVNCDFVFNNGVFYVAEI